jgi:hypothetical protein
MPAGYSLHVGVSTFDPRKTTAPPAFGSTRAAELMRDIAREQRLVQPPHGADGVLCNEQATFASVHGAFRWVCGRLAADDIFVLTIATHGRVRRDTGDGDEIRNQSFQLFDEELIDDEIYAWLSTIEHAARVLVVLDACYSGSGVTLQARAESLASALAAARTPRPAIRANVLVLAAARDTGVAQGSTSDQVAPPFTRGLEATWRAAANYPALRREIAEQMRRWGAAVEPVLNEKLLNRREFLDQRPFAI